MRDGWLRLGLLLLVLVWFTAPACAQSHDSAPHESAPSGESEKRLAQDIEGTEGNIFKGFLDLTIWSIVVFLLLLFVLTKFAWKPMLQGLQKREQSIHEAMEEAKSAKEEAAKLRAELQAEMAKARAEGQAVRDEARRDAERLRDEIAAKAREEIEAERERLRKEMDNARDSIVNDLMSQTTQLATLIASKAVKRQITIEDQNRLLDDALAELRGAAGERQRVVASIQ
jgi:F-type H+-transporting ATPase subunit b